MDDPRARWELFDHGADVGVRGRGGTVASAFEQCALALVAVSVEPSRVRALTGVAIQCDAPDLELLLVDWLNAVVYEMATRSCVFAQFDVAIAGTSLQATAYGEPLDRSRHAPAVEVKGATYTSLVVARADDGAWTAQCVVDV